MNINRDSSINQLMHKLGKYQSLINHVDNKFNKQRYQMKINEYSNKQCLLKYTINQGTSTSIYYYYYY